MFCSKARFAVCVASIAAVTILSTMSWAQTPKSPSKAPSPAPKKPKDQGNDASKDGAAEAARKDKAIRATKAARDGLDSLQKGEDPKKVVETLNTQLRALAETADPVADIDAFYAIASVRRFAMLLGAATGSDARGELLKCFAESPNFVTELVFAMDGRADDLPKVALLATRLFRERKDTLRQYATLGAALCVVHDREVTERANENTATADDPLNIYDYFVRNSAKMPLGLANVPAQLLVFVVDTTAKAGELEWSLKRFAGNADVGARFFEVRYDYDALDGAKKRLTTAGFSMQNILACGGVCIDQAYFAANVGKSLGIPSAIIRGRSDEMSHAWVGFLRWDKQSIWWDTQSGRYDAYKNVVGRVTNPQTGRTNAESELQLRAAFTAASADSRANATALADAAVLLMGFELDGNKSETAEKLTPESSARVLALSEAAANQTVACEPAWFIGVSLAKAGMLTAEQRRRWGEAAASALMKRYSDFGVLVLSEIISSIPDVAEQDKSWNWLVTRVKGHPDLEANVKFRQARMWDQNERPDLAWNCYESVVQQYADSGSSAVDAAAKCVTLVKKAGKPPASVLPMLKQAWIRTKRPTVTNPVFANQSNWYRLGALYAKALSDAGQAQQADAVANQLKSP